MAYYTLLRILSKVLENRKICTTLNYIICFKKADFLKFYY